MNISALSLLLQLCTDVAYVGAESGKIAIENIKKDLDK